MSMTTWKQALAGSIPEALGAEIEVFETQIGLRKLGRIDEKLFAETRLRRGVYGQRYDNGQRHDGVESQSLAFPLADLTKGPQTKWDAPGMQRIKVPMGKLSSRQLEVMAELAEEYSDGILHVTTRQDVQLHHVHIEDTPDLMRRLAAVGITTREACGNSVRNVTACICAGTCRTEAFDVMPYAKAVTWFLLGHDDVQDMGRKFKISFSGCKTEPCGLASFHDIGLIARTREIDGATRRGFELVVGGGLGAVPYAAQLLSDWVTEEELLPTCQAICRVFARLGEKENRMRARFKFLVVKLGIAEIRRLVAEEREKLRPDPRWVSYLSHLGELDEAPLPEPVAPATPEAEGFARWRATNVKPQRQPGFALVFVRLPLGDFTSDQARGVASLVRRFTTETLRTTVEQNLALRWVHDADLPALHAELVALGLAAPGANGLEDVVSCPGTDTCKLGISSSRGLAAVLAERLGGAESQRSADTSALRVKVSGCFNSCGQHHVADLGFLGVSRNVDGRRVPHFQVVVGGEWANNAGSFGLAIGAVPSKNVPAVVDELTGRYERERQPGESFRAFVQRIGKKEIRASLERFMAVPSYQQDPSYYRDWGDPREYTIGDIGVGECAGEVVSFVAFGLAAAERGLFEAQLLLDDGEWERAAARSLAAMVDAARALTRELHPNLGTGADEIVREFRDRLVEPGIFRDASAGGKHATYLLRHHAAGPPGDAALARQRLEEAQLFVDAAHLCHEALVARASGKVAP
ncbi:MAG: nitrite/sulfite reductase [Polyangiaceae bacterium]|nr:nitrite/sulfite reductase [Polyangiaceae bacterium]